MSARTLDPSMARITSWPGDGAGPAAGIAGRDRRELVVILFINLFASIADGSPFSMAVEEDSEITLYHRVGKTESLRGLVRLMITQSSNLATNLLIQRVSAERVNAFLRELGASEILVLRGPEDNRAFRWYPPAGLLRGFSRPPGSGSTLVFALRGCSPVAGWFPQKFMGPCRSRSACSRLRRWMRRYSIGCSARMNRIDEREDFEGSNINNRMIR